MPRLWTQAIDTHRGAVRDAILDATRAVIAEHGLRGVSMAGIAERSGIARATLYRYFPDVEAILAAWHERQVETHLQQIGAARDRAGDAPERLRAALDAYARIVHHSRTHGAGDIAALLHRGRHVARAEGLLTAMFAHLVREAAHAGAVRSDISARELARYCLHSLAAARDAPSAAAVDRLVQLTLAGLRPPGNG